MSNELQGLVYNCTLGSPVTKAIAVKLADWGDDDGGSIYPGKETIAEVTELGKRTVDEHINMLLAIGLLRLDHTGGGARNSCQYSFDMDLLAALKLCKFCRRGEPCGSCSETTIDDLKDEAQTAGRLGTDGKPTKRTLEAIRKGAAGAGFWVKPKRCGSRRVKKKKGAAPAENPAAHVENPAALAPEPNNPIEPKSAGARDDLGEVSASPASGETASISKTHPLYETLGNHLRAVRDDKALAKHKAGKALRIPIWLKEELMASPPAPPPLELTERSKAMQGEPVE